MSGPKEGITMAQPGPSEAHRVQYNVDAKLSQFTVQAFANGIMSMAAHSPKIAIRDWTGEVLFIPDTLREARISVRGKMESLEVLDELREDDRRQLQRIMHQDVLESGRFPEFTFVSSTIDSQRQKEALYRVGVSGRLTFHGITNEQSFVAQVAFGVDSFRAYGEFTLLQTDYDLKIASIAGGTMKLQDELKCSFYAVGRKKE
jgi:polyisoprenoid-binding protein YceI